MSDWWSGSPAHAIDRLSGVYDANRAAALSGVPVSTLHYWARHGIYQPSVAAGPRNRLWSWSDLLALRAIDWFRHRKGSSDALPRVSLQKIRKALDELERSGRSPADLAQIVAVSRGGELFITTSDMVYQARKDGQIGMSDVLNLVKPYLEGKGPDLLEPRPLLRIWPGKLHGEPHLVDTRIPSAAIFALQKSGYTLDQIQDMYPDAISTALSQAIEFEQSLSKRAA